MWRSSRYFVAVQNSWDIDSWRPRGGWPARIYVVPVTWPQRHQLLGSLARQVWPHCDWLVSRGKLCGVWNALCMWPRSPGAEGLCLQCVFSHLLWSGIILVGISVPVELTLSTFWKCALWHILPGLIRCTILKSSFFLCWFLFVLWRMPISLNIFHSIFHRDSMYIYASAI